MVIWGFAVIVAFIAGVVLLPLWAPLVVAGLYAGYVATKDTA